MQSSQLSQMLMNSLSLAAPYTMPSTATYQQTIYNSSQGQRISFQNRQYTHQNSNQRQLPANMFDSPDIQQTIFGASTLIESHTQSPMNKIRSKSQVFDFNQEQENLETKCTKFLKETNIFEFFRIHPCCGCDTNLRYNIKFKSSSFEANINFKSSNFISTALRCVKSFFCFSETQSEGISFKNEQLRIEVYDGKGIVYFNGTVLGSFLRRSPSFFCKTFCNEFIELIITPDKEDCFYELKKNYDCLIGCCECFLENNFACCGNLAYIMLYKNNIDVISNSLISRSNCFHCLNCICLNCFKGQWNQAKIDLSNKEITFKHKCLLLGAWFYFMEYCQ